MAGTTDARAGTRDRLVLAAGEQFRHQGYAASGIKAILDAACATYGSLYHFFPEGKEQLGVEVITTSGGVYRELVEAYFPPGVDLVDATARFFADGADLVESTAFADACPIASIALEVAETSEPMRRAASAAFDSWMAVLVERGVEAGVDRRVARDLATQLLCLVQGALLLARVGRDGDAVRTAGRAATRLVDEALTARPARPARSVRSAAGARSAGRT